MQKKEPVELIIVFAAAFALGAFVCSWGAPYIFHPDEIFILKRPFKRVLEYSQFDFSSTYSLYDFLLLCWYGCYFLLGKFLGLWMTFDAYREAIILEDFKIIYCGRLLSCTLAAAGNVVYYAFLRGYFSKPERYLVAAILVCNPFLIPSLFWIKYDALMYLLFALIFCSAYRYLIRKETDFRNYTYFLLLAALSARIEVILFALLFLLTDLIQHWHTRKIKNFFNHRLVKFCVAGLVIWMCFTLYPLNVAYKMFGGNSVGLLESKSYEGVIFSDIVSNFSRLTDVGKTFFQYTGVTILLGLPLLVLFVLCVKDEPNTIMKSLFIAYPVLFTLIISFTRFLSIHYVMAFVPFIFLLGFVKLSSFEGRQKTLWLWFVLAYALTISLPFLIINTTRPDPRMLARDYILTNTFAGDTIAVETISMHGFHPLLNECPAELKAKADYLQSTMHASPESYLLRSRYAENDHDCRYILDVFDVNYLSVNPSNSNAFINTYDPDHFEQIKPEYFVSSKPSERVNQLVINYQLAARFEPFDFVDPRCDLLYANKPAMTIYKRSPKH
jgi:hypothetical protein